MRRDKDRFTNTYGNVGLSRDNIWMNTNVWYLVGWYNKAAKLFKLPSSVLSWKSSSRGWKSGHPSPKAGAPGIQLQKLQLLTSSSRGWKSWHSSSGVERKGCFLLSCLCFFGFLLLLARLYLQPNGRPALDLKIILFLTILTRGTLIRENFSFLGFDSSSYSYLHILPCTGPGTSPIVSEFSWVFFFFSFSFFDFPFQHCICPAFNWTLFYFLYNHCTGSQLHLCQIDLPAFFLFLFSFCFFLFLFFFSSFSHCISPAAHTMETFQNSL